MRWLSHVDGAAIHHAYLNNLNPGVSWETYSENQLVNQTEDEKKFMRSGLEEREQGQEQEQEREHQHQYQASLLQQATEEKQGAVGFVWLEDSCGHRQAHSIVVHVSSYPSR